VPPQWPKRFKCSRQKWVTQLGIGGSDRRKWTWMGMGMVDVLQGAGSFCQFESCGCRRLPGHYQQASRVAFLRRSAAIMRSLKCQINSNAENMIFRSSPRGANAWVCRTWGVDCSSGGMEIVRAALRCIVAAEWFIIYTRLSAPTLNFAEPRTLWFGNGNTETVFKYRWHELHKYLPLARKIW